MGSPSCPEPGKQLSEDLFQKPKGMHGIQVPWRCGCLGRMSGELAQSWSGEGIEAEVAVLYPNVQMDPSGEGPGPSIPHKAWATLT